MFLVHWIVAVRIKKTNNKIASKNVKKKKVTKRTNVSKNVRIRSLFIYKRMKKVVSSGQRLMITLMLKNPNGLS